MFGNPIVNIECAALQQDGLNNIIVFTSKAINVLKPNLESAKIYLKNVLNTLI